MEHSDLAKVRYVAIVYIMGGIWESNPEEKKVLDYIALKFMPYVLSTKDEIPEDIVKELTPLVNNILLNMHHHKTRNDPKIIEGDGFTDMLITMYEG